MFIEAGMSTKERFDYFNKAVLDDGGIMYAGKILQRSYQNNPKNSALICGEQRITYKELYYYACLCSKRLQQMGVQKGDRVVLFLQNSIEFYIAYFGIWQVGAVVVPLNIFLSPYELRHVLQDAKPKAIITQSDKLSFFSADGVSPIMTEKDFDLHAPVPDVLPHFEMPDVLAEELVALLYTSGTTGLPKGVMLNSRNIMTNVAQALSVIPLDESQRVFCVLPLFHCFAQNTCLWSSLFAGCSVIVVSKISRGRIIEGIKHKPTIFLGVPALYGLLCLFRDIDFSSVLYFISGGDALPDKIRAMFSLIYRRKLCNGYGLTETSPLISVDFEDVTEPTNNIGVPVLGVYCSMRDDNGKEVPRGEIGELWVKGDNIMMGYYNEPEKTKEVIIDGWFNTGDLARLDMRGKLIISGRSKDLIIHKGMNIYPQEVENIILGHSHVLAVGVIGKEDQLHGQIPIAIVQLRTKADGIEESLRDLCKRHIAAYKVPRAFIVIKEMPLTATGKVDKNKLRKEYL